MPPPARRAGRAASSRHRSRAAAPRAPATACGEIERMQKARLVDPFFSSTSTRCINAIWPAGPPKLIAADLEPDPEGLAKRWRYRRCVQAHLAASHCLSPSAGRRRLVAGQLWRSFDANLIHANKASYNDKALAQAWP